MYETALEMFFICHWNKPQRWLTLMSCLPGIRETFRGESGGSDEEDPRNHELGKIHINHFQMFG